MTDSHDPGAVPADDLTPTIHPRLAFLVDNIDRLRTLLALQRQVPANDANARMRLVELEKMGVWFPELVPERGRRATETALMAAMMFLRRNKSSAQEMITALPGIVIGARAVAEAYEQASMPEVLAALNAIEACFEESEGQIFSVVGNSELRDACIQLVTALRMQNAPPDAPATPGTDAEGEPEAR